MTPSPSYLSYSVEFHVEATGVADWLSLCVSSPKGGGGGVTVGAGQADPPRGRLQHIKHVTRQSVVMRVEIYSLLLLLLIICRPPVAFGV